MQQQNWICRSELPKQVAESWKIIPPQSLALCLDLLAMSDILFGSCYFARRLVLLGLLCVDSGQDIDCIELR